MMNGSITTLKTNHRSTVHREDGGNPIFSEMYRAQPKVLVNCTKVQPVCSVSYRFLCYLGDLCYLNDHPRSSTINTNVMNCGTEGILKHKNALQTYLLFINIKNQTLPRHNRPNALSNLTHSTPLPQSRSFNKHWNLDQTSVCFCLEKGEKNKEKLWQIHVIP